MKKNKFLLLLFIIFLSSCLNNTQTTEREKIKNKIVSEYIKKKEKEGFYAIGVGGGEMDGKTNLIEISFQTKMKYGIDEWRKITIKLVDDLISLINEKSGMDPYFIEFPFNEKYIKIMVISSSPLISHDDIDSTLFHKNLIFFKTTSAKKLIRYKVETYEEAKSILENEMTR